MSRIKDRVQFTLYHFNVERFTDAVYERKLSFGRSFARKNDWTTGVGKYNINYRDKNKHRRITIDRVENSVRCAYTGAKSL